MLTVNWSGQRGRQAYKILEMARKWTMHGRLSAPWLLVSQTRSGGSGDLNDTGIQRGQTRCEHQDGLV